MRENLDQQTINEFNTTIFGIDRAALELKGFTTPRGLISYFLPYAFTLAGLILFIMIVWGGFEMLTGAADPKSQEAGKQRIINALIGFLILFCAFWLAKIVQIVFGISILG